MFSPVRVCRACQTRYTLPTPVWERSIFAVIFLMAAVFFGLIAFGIGELMREGAKGNAGMALRGQSCSGLVWAIAALFLAQAARELGRRRKEPGQGLPEGWRERFDGEDRVAASVVPPGTVPTERAEALLCAIAQKHGAMGILRRLGQHRADHLANATARFAREMGEDETVLAVLDTSFLGNGKAGLIVTNRGVYSSFRPGAIWLSDIQDVSYLVPRYGDLFAAWSLRGKLRLIFQGTRHLQYRLLVNGDVVHAGTNNLRADFWIELLTTLAAEARAARVPFGDGVDARPRIPVLETSLYPPGEPAEVRHLRDPSWREVEQSIRALDGEHRPSVRLCAGEGLALDILGGHGTYALREPGDGWVYYDPSQGEEEVEVCTGAAGYRCPAFYVCTDLNRVLEIARHFLEAGAFD